jgi:hypothetical protein
VVQAAAVVLRLLLVQQHLVRDMLVLLALTMVVFLVEQVVVQVLLQVHKTVELV